MDYGFLQDPHLPPGSPQQRPLTVLTMLETTTGLSNAILTTKKGDTTHQRQQIKKWITTNGFANSILQTDSEAAILQLGEHVSRELGLRFRLVHHIAFKATVRWNDYTAPCSISYVL